MSRHPNADLITKAMADITQPIWIYRANYGWLRMAFEVLASHRMNPFEAHGPRTDVVIGGEMPTTPPTPNPDMEIADEMPTTPNLRLALNDDATSLTADTAATSELDSKDNAITLTLTEKEWVLLRDYADAALAEKQTWLDGSLDSDIDDRSSEQAEIDGAAGAVRRLIDALENAPVRASFLTQEQRKLVATVWVEGEFAKGNLGFDWIKDAVLSGLPGLDTVSDNDLIERLMLDVHFDESETEVATLLAALGNEGAVKVAQTLIEVGDMDAEEFAYGVSCALINRGLPDPYAVLLKDAAPLLSPAQV